MGAFTGTGEWNLQKAGKGWRRRLCVTGYSKTEAVHDVGPVSAYSSHVTDLQLIALHH